MDEKTKREVFAEYSAEILRERIRTLEQTVDELREINQDLAEENGRLEREITKYKCVIEAVKSRINQRRADIQEMSKRIEHSLNATRATLKYCEDMSNCIDTEEHYADTVY